MEGRREGEREGGREGLVDGREPSEKIIEEGTFLNGHHDLQTESALGQLIYI